MAVQVKKHDTVAIYTAFAAIVLIVALFAAWGFIVI